MDGSDAAIGDCEVGDRERTRAFPHWLRARVRARAPPPRHRVIVRAVDREPDQHVADRTERRRSGRSGTNTTGPRCCDRLQPTVAGKGIAMAASGATEAHAGTARGRTAPE